MTSPPLDTLLGEPVSLDEMLTQLTTTARFCGMYHLPSDFKRVDELSAALRSHVLTLQTEREEARNERDALKAHLSKQRTKVREAAMRVREAANACHVEGLGCGWCHAVVGHRDDCEGVRNGAMATEAEHV